jgi:hypothetical protein
MAGSIAQAEQGQAHIVYGEHYPMLTLRTVSQYDLVRHCRVKPPWVSVILGLQPRHASRPA